MKIKKNLASFRNVFEYMESEDCKEATAMSATSVVDVAQQKDTQQNVAASQQKETQQDVKKKNDNDDGIGKVSESATAINHQHADKQPEQDTSIVTPVTQSAPTQIMIMNRKIESIVDSDNETEDNDDYTSGEYL
ncbi:hypothetical protein HT594_00036 [Phenacoccus solenopsis nudivirus]|nr:hypothetical protein HT594_00036 [Phenacoccus solenopsis nudivirus]